MPSEKIERYSSNSIELERQSRYAPAPMHVDQEQEAPTVPLSHYVWILRRSAWKILGFVAICMIATFVVCQRVTPVYESVAKVDVDRRAPSGIVGQESSQTSAINDSDQFLTTQIELIQSDAVLRPIAQKYGLLIREQQITSEGTEKARQLANAPVVLKNLKITRPPNSYILRIAYRSTDPELAANVANAIAQSYLAHTFNIRIRSTIGLSSFMEKQIDELKAKMEGSSQALAEYERELNVINPEEKTNILSARLLQLNTEYTNAQAERVRKETAYNSLQTGNLAAVQVSSQGESLAKLQERLQELQSRFAEVKTTYGPNHAEYRKVSNQLTEVVHQYDETKSQIAARINIEYQQAKSREDMLRKSVTETKAEYDKLNANSFQYQQLKREAEADKKLYDELVRKIKEAGINAGFQNSAIRIADLARPGAKAVFPNTSINLIVAFVIATIIALSAAVIGDVLDNTVKDPEQISRTLNIDVVGTLPAVKGSEMVGLTRPGTVVADAGETAVPAKRGYHYKGIGSYEEAIRTLRNSVLLSDFDRNIKSILITSASPGEGKSTTALHLAVAHAEQGKNTLIIDADLRRPTLHKRFETQNSVGLSDALTGVLHWRDVVITVDGRPNLAFIPSGPASRRASDLIGPVMVELLDEAAKEYDLIIIDAPPLLGFAEPLQMATAADGVVIVTRAGETSRKAVATVLTTLARLRTNVLGLVLNQVKKEMSDSYYYYGYYRKYYHTQGNPKNA